ncbi:uncharacterized protein M6B38_319840 [Iris pallida]|uniref:Nuclease associated modular domain-containing protein n=1 Tax=Iris pallida TaxID=29817 RepID=A0AAX6HBE5_IRIPA|nr:uncharacterized protein M6B38_319840 [Iris pallida]
MTMEAAYVSAVLRKSVPCLSFHSAPNTFLGPVVKYNVDGVQFQQAPFRAAFKIVPLKNVFPAFNSISSKEHHIEKVFVIDEFPNKIDRSHLSTGSALEQITNEKISVDSHGMYKSHNIDAGLCEEVDSSSSVKVTAHIRDKEIQRRKKIGLANKGKTPWNKGRKHTEETRERIKQRTIEALSDPKVRRKMSESPRSHSDRSRARISFSLRKIWEERLKKRTLQENCYLTWAGSIADAARKGGGDQEELEWDSYEKIKSAISTKHLKWKARKERAKEIAKVKAEIAAKVRAENAERRAQKALEKEERAKAREMKALARKKSENEKMRMALSKGLKLKARLTKFHHHKKQSGSSTVTPREITLETRALSEELDIELIKMRKMRKRVTLAEQIRDVKNRKADSPRKVQSSANSTLSIEVKEGEVYTVSHLMHSSKHDMLDQLD